MHTCRHINLRNRLTISCSWRTWHTTNLLKDLSHTYPTLILQNALRLRDAFSDLEKTMPKWDSINLNTTDTVYERIHEPSAIQELKLEEVAKHFKSKEVQGLGACPNVNSPRWPEAFGASRGARPSLLLPSIPNKGATHQLSGKHVRLNTTTKESQGL